MAKTWFITGTSRGFGRVWAEAALARGDRVAATARDLNTLTELVAAFPDRLLPLRLDVTDREAVFAAVAQAHEHFGGLDVVVNNAGYGHFGFVEEITEAEARAQIDTNLFGALWVTQAVLPLMRARGGGHILQISSIGGVVAYPRLGMYHASKWALEGLTEALAGEVAGFGIKTTIIEPGGYATDWIGASAVNSQHHEVYQPFHDAIQSRMVDVKMPSPASTVEAILTVVDAENPPTRLLLSGAAFDTVVPAVEQRLSVWRQWEEVSRSADDA